MLRNLSENFRNILPLQHIEAWVESVRTPLRVLADVPEYQIWTVLSQIGSIHGIKNLISKFKIHIPN